ncbi:AraC family transcriptional regulator [Neobacillus niacini]|uniref:AraC family transcriptional regulator n=1 Tax=Neobacillus niacini TaxID=86668 RepID=UPI002FFECBBB
MIEDRFFYRTYTHSSSEIAKKLWFFVHSVGWFVCKPTYDVQRDRLFDFQLKYVVSGKGKIEWHGRIFNVGPGDIFFLDLNQPHRYYADPNDPFEVFWVHFGGSQVEDYFHLLDINNTPVYQFHNLEETQELFHQLFEMFNLRQVGHEAKASAVITHILTNMIVMRMKGGSPQSLLETPTYPEPIQQVIYFMENHFIEPLKLEEIANEIMLSPYHFSRLFKRTTGYSVMEYLQKFRIKQAKYLLAKTDNSIGEIAEKTGFSDQSYFGKLFKRFEKQTPKEYRIAHKAITHQPEHIPPKTDTNDINTFVQSKGLY